MRVVEGIWGEFEDIQKVDLPTGVTDNSANFGAWLQNAINDSGVSVPAGFPKTVTQVLTAQVSQEGGTHSYNRAPVDPPLSACNIQIGENNAGQGVTLHTFTDGGIGFAKIQPYNSDDENIYDPEGNLTRQCEFLKDKIDNVPQNLGTTDSRIVWYGLFAYNQGNYAAAFNSPQAIRDNGNDSQKHSASYADAIFNDLGVALP